MSDRVDDEAAALVELAPGGVVIAATAAAAAILKVAPDQLVGRTVEIVDDDVDIATTRGLEIFADLSSLALFVQDAPGRIIRWNRGAERIFGYTEAEVLGEVLTSLVPLHLRSDLQSVAERVAAGERIDRVFSEIQRKDGMPLPIALSVSPVFGVAGRYLGAVGVAQELTEIRLAQAALAEVEQRFGEWEALAHVGRWLWDVGTDAVQWSDELHRMHEVDPPDFEGTLAAHLRVVHPDDRDRLRSLMQGAVASSQPIQDEYRLLAADGTTRWFAMRAEPAVGSSGDVVGLRGVSHDITLSVVRR